MLKTRRFTIGFIAWMILITVLSLVSFSQSDVPGIDIPHLDKAVHFTFYAVATVLGCFVLRERYEGVMGLPQSLLTVGAFTILYGIGIEVLQQKLPGTRDGNAYDAIANTIGTLAGAVAIIGIFSKKSPLKWKF